MLRLTLDGWAIDIEMLVIAARHGLRVREIPIEWHYRERSRISPVRTHRMTRDVRIAGTRCAGVTG